MTRHIANVVLIRKNKVFLLKRNPLRENFPGVWGFPGGHVERGETIEHALFREAQEEIGVELVSVDKIYDFSIVHNNEKIFFHVFYSGQFVGEPMIIGDEHVEADWVRLEQAPYYPNIALDGYRTALMCINDNGIRADFHD